MQKGRQQVEALKEDWLENPRWRSFWDWALFAGGAIFLAVLSINFVGDGLRDALDPRKVM